MDNLVYRRRRLIDAAAITAQESGADSVDLPRAQNTDIKALTTTGGTEHAPENYLDTLTAEGGTEHVPESYLDAATAEGGTEHVPQDYTDTVTAEGGTEYVAQTYTDEITVDGATENVPTSYLDTLTANGGTEHIPKAYLDSVTQEGVVEQRNLPQGYTELEYIESDGTAWLDTGYIANGGMIFDGKVMPIGNELSIGSIGPSTIDPNTTRNLIAYTSPGVYTAQKLGRYNVTYADAGTSPAVIHFDTTDTKFYCTVNGNVVVDDTTGTLTNQTATVKIGFANYSGAIRKGRYYPLQFRNSNGDLVRDLKPAKNSSNIVSMYDFVSNTFLPVQGTGAFTAGPALTPTPERPMDLWCNNGVLKTRHESGLPLEYQRVEYLQTDGNSYIDTGVLLSNTDVFEIAFQSPNSLSTPVMGAISGGAAYTSTDNLCVTYTIASTLSAYSVYCDGAAGNANYSWNGGNRADGQKHAIKYNGLNVAPTLDGVAMTQITSYILTANTPTVTTWLFGRNNTSTGTMAQSGVRIFDVNIQGKGHFIPAKRNSDNVLGMYDLVSGQFFTNAGTGTFTAGADVADPVEIYTDGTPEVLTVRGKNLFDYSAVIETGEYINDSGVVAPDPFSAYWLNIPVKPSTTYTCSGVANFGGNIRLHGYTIDGTWDRMINKVPAISGDIIFTFTTNANEYFIGISGHYAQFESCQLELGSTATTYEPYIDPQTASVPDLLAVGDYKDTDELIAGLLTHKVGVKVLDGTESWETQDSYFYIEGAGMGINHTAGATSKCTNYTGVSNNSGLTDTPDFAIRVGYFNPNSGAYDRIYIKDVRYSGETDLTAFKQYLAAQYAAGTPVIVIYPLATSTTESHDKQLVGLTADYNTVDIQTNVTVPTPTLVTSTHATPKPDYPLDLRCNNGVLGWNGSAITVTGTQEELTVSGKNLFDKSAVSFYTLLNTSTGEEIPQTNQYSWASDWISVMPTTSYYFKAGTDWPVRIFEYDSNKTYLNLNYTKQDASFATNLSCRYIRFHIGYMAGGQAMYNGETMVSWGSTATAYEPYVEYGTADIERLLKVNSTYVDTQEVVNGLVTHKIGIKVLTGDSTKDGSWATSAGASNLYSLTIADSSTDNTFSPISTHFVGVLGSVEYAAIQNGQFKHGSNSNAYYFKDASSANIDAFKARLAAEYAAGTPVIVLYPLATATTETVAPQLRGLQGQGFVASVTAASVSGLTTGLTESVHTTPMPYYPLALRCNNGVLEAHNPSGIPLEYTELEYIQSSGTQYIDTGCSPNANWRITTEVMFTSFASSTDPCTHILGARDQAQVGGGYGIRAIAGEIASDYFGDRQSLGTIATGTWYTIDKNKNVCTINDVTVTAPASTASVTRNASLFGMNLEAGQKSYNGTFAQKETKVWDNDVLILDLVPAKRNSDSVLGMYDLVSDIFFTNAGTGAFTAGPKVAPIVDAEGPAETTTVTYGTESWTATPVDLLGVGTYKDTQAYMSGLLTKNVGIKVLDGTEGWTQYSSNNGFTSFYIDNVAGGVMNGICSHFEYYQFAGASLNRECFAIGGPTNQRIFIVRTNDYTTTSLKQFLAAQYAAGDPVIVVYPLATATTSSEAPQLLDAVYADETITRTAAISGLTATKTTSSHTTPSPRYPLDLRCNNGALKYGFKYRSYNVAPTLSAENYPGEAGRSVSYSDGVLICEITASAGSNLGLYPPDIFSFTAGHKYTCIANAKGNTRIVLGAAQMAPSGAITGAGATTADQYTLTSDYAWYAKLWECNTNATCRLNIRVISSSSDAGQYASFKDILLVDLTAIFGAGNEPTTPSDIIQSTLGVYTDGTPEVVKVSGKNLFDKNAVTYVAPDVSQSDYMPVVAGQQYYIGDRGSVSVVKEYDANKSSIQTLYIGSHYYTPSANTAFVRVNVSDSYLDTFQLERGSAPTTYEPYIEPQTTSDISMLLAVGNYKDTEELIGGIRTGKVGIKVLDGTEGWYRYGTGKFATPLIGSKKQDNQQAPISSHFIGVSFNNVPNTDGRISVFNGSISQTSGTLGINYQATPELVDFKAFLAAQYAAGTPVIVIYPLAAEATTATTPQIHPIPTATPVVTVVQASMSPLGTGYTASTHTTPAPACPLSLKCNNGVVGWNGTSITVTGTQEVIELTGKNVLNNTPYKTGYYIDASGVEQPGSPTDEYIIRQASVRPNTRYTLSYTGNSTSYTQRWHAYDKDGNWLSQIAYNIPSAIGQRVTYTFTTPANCYYVRQGGRTQEDYQLEQGATATAYEAYHSYGTANISNLFKVGDYADTENTVNGLVTHKVGVKVLTGTEEWTASGNYTGSCWTPWSSWDYSPALDKPIFCTHFIGHAGTSGYAPGMTIINGLSLSIWMSSATTPTSLKAFLAAQYAAGTPVIVIYPLATATTETVTAQFPSVSGTGFQVAQIDGSIKGLATSAADSVHTTPAPLQPLDLRCNNGVLKARQNLWDGTTGEDGYLAASGAVVPASSGTLYKSSDYISIKASTDYSFYAKYTESANGRGFRICFYTSAKAFIAPRQGGDTAASGEYIFNITSPADAAYMRMSDKVLGTAETICVEGNYTVDTIHSAIGSIYVDGTQEIVKVTGKNLTPVNIDGTYTGDGTSTNISNDLWPDRTIKENTQYTISMRVVPSGVTYSAAGNLAWFSLKYTDGTSDNTGITTTNYQDGLITWTTEAGKTLASDYRLVLSRHTRWTGGTLTIADLQIEEGATATTYEPYHDYGTAAINDLFKVDATYVDTHEVVSGLVTHKIGIKVLDGTENWTTQYSNAIITGASAAWNAEKGKGGYCTHLRVLETGQATAAGTCRFANDFNIYDYQTAFGVTSLDGFKAYLAAQYAAGDPVIILYPLATATTETVTPQRNVLSAKGNSIRIEIIVASMSPLNVYDAETIHTIPAPEQPLQILTNNGVMTVDGQGNIGTAGPAEQIYARSKNLWDEVYPDVDTSIRYRSIYLGPGQYTMSTDDYPLTNGAMVFFLNGQQTSGANNPTNGVYKDTPRTVNSTTGWVTVAYRDGWGPGHPEWVPSDFHFQIEKGSTATYYMRHKISLPVSPEMLLKVGDYSDSQEIVNGVVKRNVGVKVFDGTENWRYDSTYNVFYVGIDTMKSSPQGMFCTHFTQKAYTGAAPCFGYIYLTNLFIKDGTSDLTAFKAFLAAQYAAGTPVIVIYPLAAETTESVAGQTLHLMRGQNTIYAESPLAAPSFTFAAKYNKHEGFRTVQHPWTENTFVDGVLTIYQTWQPERDGRQLNFDN